MIHWRLQFCPAPVNNTHTHTEKDRQYTDISTRGKGKQKETREKTINPDENCQKKCGASVLWPLLRNLLRHCFVCIQYDEYCFLCYSKKVRKTCTNILIFQLSAKTCSDKQVVALQYLFYVFINNKHFQRTNWMPRIFIPLTIFLKKQLYWETMITGNVARPLIKLKWHFLSKLWYLPWYLKSRKDLIFLSSFPPHNVVKSWKSSRMYKTKRT